MLTRIRKNKYDKVINVQRFFATGILTAFSGAKESIGFDKNPLSFLFSKKIKHRVGGDQSVHETIRNLALIREFTDDAECKPKLYPSAADYDSVDKWIALRIYHFKSGLGLVYKTISGFEMDFFHWKYSSRFSIYLLGGPGDLALCESIREASPRNDFKVLAGSLIFYNRRRL